MKSPNIIALVPAAGRPTNQIMMNSNLPDTMVPINGKPVIAYIIEDLMSRGIRRAIVTLHKDDQHTEKYLVKKFKSACNITVLYDESLGRGVGYSLYLARPYIKNLERVLVYLGDTIYKGPLSFAKDFLVVSDTYESPEKWCFVEKDKEGILFVNKPREYSGKGPILCGLYFFKDGQEFKKAATDAERKHEIIELSHILKRYAKYHNFSLVPARLWYDCGNIENFHKAKIDFLKVRSFNSIRYDDLRGHITKSSSNKGKILHEINWFRNIPTDLRIFTPRLIDYKVRDNTAEYSLEFYGYQTLADFFVLGSLDAKLWHGIIAKLFNIIDLFKAHIAKIPYSRYEDVYYAKTLERLNVLKKDAAWKKLLKKNSITINGTSYRNINHFLPNLKKAVAHLYEKDKMNFIHGDLFLGNILFDPTSRIFKFIDPKGSFGKTSIYGDSKYDIAKLRHSFSGLYDFIMSDLFELREPEHGVFTLVNHAEDYHKNIGRYFDDELTKRGYDLEKIRLIEALLFLSMIPLHDDNRARQKAMYLTGIRLINESSLL